MSRIETYFLLLVVLNLCVTAAYVLWNEQHWREEPGKRTGGRIRAAVMLLAPVIGSVFFVAGELARHLLFGQSADLEDVIFSKERVRTHFYGGMRSRSGMWCRSRRHWRFPTGIVCAH